MLLLDFRKSWANDKIEKGSQFLESLVIISDLDWIQTSNLLSRNQVRYSVAPRGRFEGANILFFAYLQTIFCHKITPANNC